MCPRSPAYSAIVITATILIIMVMIAIIVVIVIIVIIEATNCDYSPTCR